MGIFQVLIFREARLAYMKVFESDFGPAGFGSTTSVLEIPGSTHHLRTIWHGLDVQSITEPGNSIIEGSVTKLLQRTEDHHVLTSIKAALGSPGEA